MAGKVLLATASYDRTIKFWEAPSGLCYRTIPYPEGQINAMAIDPSKKYLLVGGNTHLRCYDVNHSSNSNPVHCYEGHKGNIMSVGFQRDGAWFFTGGEDETVKVWDLNAPKPQESYAFGSPVNAVCLHPNQVELIAGLQNGLVVVHDIIDNRVLRVMRPSGEMPVRSLSINGACMHLAVANNKGELVVYNLAADASSDRSLLRGEVRPYAEHVRIQAHKAYILKAVFSADGDLLATASADATIKIFKARDEYQLSRTLVGHQRWVWDAAFSADGAYLLSASSDQFARLWDVAQGETIRHYTGHQKTVNCVALSDFSVRQG